MLKFSAVAQWWGLQIKIKNMMQAVNRPVFVVYTYVEQFGNL